MENFNEELGSILKEARTNKGLALRPAVDLILSHYQIKLSHASLSTYERGTRDIPAFTLLALIDFYQLDYLTIMTVFKRNNH